MASQDVTNAVNEAGTLLTALATAQAAVATAEQANGLPALRTAVATARANLATYMASTFGLTTQQAATLALVLPPAEGGAILSAIVTAAATLQAQ